MLPVRDAAEEVETLRGLWWLIAPVVIIALLVIQLVRPVPAVELRPRTPANFTVQGPPLNLPWPSRGQSALAISGVGVVGSSGSKSPQPIASLAKMMVAYLILHDHPLGSGQNGPTITVTPADAALYRTDAAGNQSVLPVVAGERLTERQMLEGLLLPSGNNIATMLAQWDAGSLSAFVAKMNTTAKALGMTNTHYADASGLSSATVSTAIDELKLAQAAMAIHTFASIVALPQASLPVAGVVYNVNGFLGRSGIIGIKTGSTSAAGGCFVVAANATVGTRTVLVLGAVLGQGGLQELNAALTAGENLVNAARRILTTAQPLKKGQVAAQLVVPWAPPVDVTVPTAPSFVGWQGFKGTTQVAPTGGAARSVAAGAQVATLTVTLGQQRQSMPLKAPSSIPPPSLVWRLSRP